MRQARLPLLTMTAVLALAACSRHKDRVESPASEPAPVTTAPAPAATPAPPATTATNPTVGGAAMSPTATIATNAALAPNLSTLVAAMKAADLTATLSGPGPFTVFAPINDAFSRLPPATIDALMKPENKASLTKVLTYHVVAGTMTLDQLKSRIVAGGGTTMLTTIEGDPLTVTLADNVMMLTDVNGNKSYVQTPDVRQSNGVVHIVNGVLVPKLN